MSIGARSALAALALAFGVSGAAVAADPATKQWRKLGQFEDKSATYINEPGSPQQGNQFTVRLVVVYKPGVQTFQGQAVAWEEFPALTIDCMIAKARKGEHIRHAADGSVIGKDSDAAFRLFDGGSNEDDVAKAKCEGQYSGKTFQIKDGPNWIADARKNIAYVAGRAPK